MRVIVVGGGIGGMTTALSLHRAGIQVEVYEAVSELKELGVGINVLPHATRELTELGLQSDLAAAAIETRELIYYTKRGQPIWREPRGVGAGYKWPQFSINRGRLLMILVNAVEAHLGPECIHVGHRFVDFEQDDRGVKAHFVHPSTGEPVGSAHGDLLIGADGVHSAVRRQLYPNEGLPKFSGITMWRGVGERKPFFDGRTMIVAGNWHARVVAYPISREAADRGMSSVNWVAEIRDESKTDWQWDDWSRVGSKEDFLWAFKDYKFEWMDFSRLFEQTETVFEYPMIDRDPLDRWTLGRVSLLGDAAHPMYPSGSNGAAQAVLDARALAAVLTRGQSVEQALRTYEGERIGPTAKIVLSNREFEAERVLKLVDERCPHDCENIYDYVSREEMAEISDRYKKIAGFEKESLNTRRSYGEGLDR